MLDRYSQYEGDPGIQAPSPTWAERSMNMASKKRMELIEVIEMIEDMRYVAKLRDAIHECIIETAYEMAEDDTVECDNEILIQMALEEIIYGVRYSGKDIKERMANSMK